MLTLKHVGSAAFCEPEKIYALIVYRSCEEGACGLYGSGSSSPNWLVYSLSSADGRVLIGVFTSREGADLLFAVTVEQLDLVPVDERVAVRRGITTLVHPVASSFLRVKINLNVRCGLQNFAVCIPRSITIEEATSEIERIVEKLNMSNTSRAAAVEQAALEPPSVVVEPTEMTQ